MRRKNVVTIGGGTGNFAVLTALKPYPVNLTAVVSMADDGGSSGILRDQYGVLPPGDIRRVLVALSESSETLRELFNYRFSQGSLHGHSLGNLFLSALEKMTGDFASAVREASQVLNIRGEVVPVTLDNVRLYAKLADGKTLKGETNIDIPKSSARSAIKKIWLEPAARMNPRIKKILKNVDLIILGPGDLYTSLIPNLLVKGLPEEIRKSKAKKVYIANLMTKFGETHNFRAADFIQALETYLGKGVIDYVIFNNKKPPQRILQRYQKEKSEFVDPAGLNPAPFSRKLTRRPLHIKKTRDSFTKRCGVNLKQKKPKYILTDLLDSGKFIRHSHRKLAKVILSLL